MTHIINISIAVATLFLGWYGRDIISRFQKKRNNVLISQIVKNNHLKTYPWLIKYYIDSDQGEYLYTCEDGKKIPYLTRHKWQNNPKVAFNFRSDEKKNPIDKNIIKLRELAGQKVWDGPVYLLNGITNYPDRIVISLAKGTYFQYASSASKLQQETNLCSVKGSRPKLRDKIAKTIYSLENADIGAQIVGVTTVLTFNLSDGKYVIIQERSNKTAIAGGYSSVTPAFTCAPDPIPSNAETDTSEFLFHFFLKELLEELYNSKELEDDHDRVDPDWFYQISPIPQIISLRQSQACNFNLLGFGFDLTTGELHIACSVSFDDIAFCEAQIKLMQHNWEIDGIKLYRVGSPELRDILLSDKMYTTSKFALSMFLQA